MKNDSPADHAHIPLERLIETAHGLADAAGAVTLAHFRTPLTVDNKAGGGHYDPVTEADRNAEQVMRKRLASLHPEHGVLGEEHGASDGRSPYTWVIDPIDGTRAFITGMPLWGTLIGVTEHGRAVAGMMDQPYMRERIWSSPDATLWRGPGGTVRRVSTSPTTSLTEARLTSTTPDMFVEADEQAAFAAVRSMARLTRFGGDCYAYCLLAAGHIDVVMEAGLKPYDIVALVPIIERAGGVVTTWEGNRPEGGGHIVASANARLHESLLATIAAATA